MMKMEIRMEPETVPTIQPNPLVEPEVAPSVDPDRRLNPDRLCPAQKREIVRKIAGS